MWEIKYISLLYIYIYIYIYSTSKGLFALPEDGDHIQYKVRNLNHYNITKEEFAQNCSNYFSRKLRFTVIQGLTNDVVR